MAQSTCCWLGLLAGWCRVHAILITAPGTRPKICNYVLINYVFRLKRKNNIQHRAQGSLALRRFKIQKLRLIEFALLCPGARAPCLTWNNLIQMQRKTHLFHFNISILAPSITYRTISLALCSKFSNAVHRVHCTLWQSYSHFVDHTLWVCVSVNVCARPILGMAEQLSGHT